MRTVPVACVGEVMGVRTTVHFHEVLLKKYKMRLEAFVEEKLDRAVTGSLTPGTEVIFLARSKRGDAPMFEFRWHRDARELRVGKREQIRHYDAEPLDLIDVVGVKLPPSNWRSLTKTE